MPEDKNEPALDSSFVQLLTKLRQGELCHEASDDLEALTKQVQATGKVGTLTIKISVKPTGMGRVTVGDDLTVKMPKAQVPATPLFATESGQLLANDPAQMALPLNITKIQPKPLAKAAGE